MVYQGWGGGYRQHSHCIAAYVAVFIWVQKLPIHSFGHFPFCDYGVFSVPQAIWRFSSMGVPQNAWLILDNPMEMDDLGAPL